jgi:DNA-binding GntR family transcriptional regulator
VLSESASGARHRTLAERAFEVLHESILNGRLSPGQRLPIEEIASGLEMSPMPVREALRRLDSAGLVEHVPHRGATVTQLSRSDLFDVYRTRLVLEPLVIHESAKRFAASDVEAAERHLAEFDQLIADGRKPEAWSAHTNFHFALYAPADSRWLIRSIEPLWESSERYRHAGRIRDNRLEDRQREHKAMLAACAEGNGGKAALELYNHLVHSANDVASAMDSGPLFATVEKVADIAIGPSTVTIAGDSG